MSGVSQNPPFPAPEGKVEIRFQSFFVRQLAVLNLNKENLGISDNMDYKL